ncbi:MAG: hypothetical protein IT308_01425 [Anaerolineaceae bacterium]|nr:hypothetical protein [Anaerolineaceae bacterium]
MLVLLPVFLLTLTLIALLALARFKRGAGLAWLVSVSAGLLTWVVLLVQLFIRPSPFSLTEWYLGEGATTNLVFQLDQSSWPYAFGLVSLLLAVVMSDASRFEFQANPLEWGGSLVVVIGGLLAVLAETPLALIFAWTLIDIFELVILLQTVEHQQQKQQAVVAFGARLAGIMMIIWAVLVSRAGGQGLTLASFPPQAGIFLLIAAGLRLGVIPLHLPYREEPRLRRGLGTAIRMAVPASSLVLLSRLPPTVVPPVWAPYFLLFTSLAAVYGSVRWLTARDELAGRPYWIIAIAGLAIGSAVRGRPVAALAWGAAMLFAGGFIFLFSARNRALWGVAILSWIGLTGLPFTPAASGWQGLVVLPFSILDVMYILVHTLLLLGFLRHSLSPGLTMDKMEGWAKAVYSLGLVLLVISHWLTGIFGWQSSFTVGNWWASAASALLCLVGAISIWLYTQRPLQQLEGTQTWLLVFIEKIGSALGKILNLNWFYRLGVFFFRILQRLVNFLTLILEGEGGILWALVLLVLIVSFLLQRGPQ